MNAAEIEIGAAPDPKIRNFAGGRSRTGRRKTVGGTGRHLFRTRYTGEAETVCVPSILATFTP